MIINMSKDSDSKLIFENKYGVQIRYAITKSATWPGWAASLDKKGYWSGTVQDHKYIGPTKADLEAEKLKLSI